MLCVFLVSSRYFEDYEDELKDLSYGDSDEDYDDDDYSNDRDVLEGKKSNLGGAGGAKYIIWVTMLLRKIVFRA